MKTSSLIIIIVVVALLAGGVYFLTKSNYSTSSNPPTATAPSANANPTASNPSTPPTSNTPASPSPAATPQTHNVEISGFAFSPASLTMQKGDTVIWTNSDPTSHTVTSDSGSELSSSPLSNGKTYSHTFNSAGTFNYHCSIHTSMKASIVVE